MRAERRRANQLDGRTWTRYSVSIWSDIRKSKDELRLKHPALFPVELPRRLIECFLPPAGRAVLDPFCGLGSTVLAAHQLGRVGIGLDINREYVETAERRLYESDGTVGLFAPAQPSCGCRLICADARELGPHVPPSSVDLVVTSPPYWNILTRRRSADGKQIRHYGEEGADLGRVSEYRVFLAALSGVFGQVWEALRPRAYCIVVVMDIRTGSTFHPFHADVASAMQELGYLFDDLIIWDRRHEYNHLRPLGHPSVFRINKAHEYLLIFQKPALD